MNLLKYLKELKMTIENKGEELVITAKGSKETVSKLEKKLEAIKELGDDCCCCNDDKENCC